jgi:hypothetical protein
MSRPSKNSSISEICEQYRLKDSSLRGWLDSGLLGFFADELKREHRRSSTASVQASSKAEATDDVGGNALGVADGLVDSQVTGEIGFMDALEAAEEGSECCVSALAGIAVHLALPVTVIVSSPFLGRVTNGEVVRPALVAAQLVAVEHASRR